MGTEKREPVKDDIKDAPCSFNPFSPLSCVTGFKSTYLELSHLLPTLSSTYRITFWFLASMPLCLWTSTLTQRPPSILPRRRQQIPCLLSFPIIYFLSLLGFIFFTTCLWVENCVPTCGLLFTGCVVLDKYLNFTEFQYSYLQSGDNLCFLVWLREWKALTANYPFLCLVLSMHSVNEDSLVTLTALPNPLPFCLHLSVVTG